MTHVPNPLDQLSIEQLRQRTSEKWRRYPADVLPLWVAEMDVVPAQPVIDVVHHAMTGGDTGYPSGNAYPRALQSFAVDQWASQDAGAADAGFHGERMKTVPDVMSGIVAALQVLTEPGDAVIVCSPVYPPFYIYTKGIKRKVVEAPLTAAGRLDPVAIREAFATARTTTTQPVLLLANPHNPTGVAHTREELETVAEMAREFNARVISDEIHAPLVLPGARFVPFLSVKGAENGFSVFSASKAWNLPGLKAAVLSAGPESARDMAAIPGTVEAGASHLGVLAHSAALEHGRTWLEALLSGLAANRDLVDSLVREHLPGVSLHRPEATYLAWLDCSSLELPEPAGAGAAGRFHLTGPAAFFLDHAGVALNDGATFGTGGKGFVRLNYGTTPAILREAIERMGAALRSVHS